MPPSSIISTLIFEALFKNNSPVLILKFLEEDTHWLEDLKIMSSVPTLPFFKAAIAEIFKFKPIDN
jgi:lycopene beta-cyclase